MRKLFLFLSCCALTGISFVCQGQYTGGNDDGFSSGALIASTCAVAANANIYFGGGSNISSSNGLSASVCAAPANANIYFGGVQDGSSSATLAVSVCPVPLNSNIYFGGVQDGSSSGALVTSVCPVPLNSNIYFGGVQDGSSSGTLTVSVCPLPINANIYFGGAQDGFSSVYLKTLLAACLLRIDLPSFTGNCSGGATVLDWSTATENNNAYFTIEYSPDGVNWRAIGTLPGAGNSSTPLYYSFTDKTYRAGTAYYRLQQTDLDGKFSLSSVISVGSCTVAGTDKLNVYPNPSPGQLILTFDGDKTRVQSIEIFDVLGERIYYRGGWQSGIDLSDRPSGTYFVHFTTDARTVIKEVVLKKD